MEIKRDRECVCREKEIEGVCIERERESVCVCVCREGLGDSGSVCRVRKWFFREKENVYEYKYNDKDRECV